MDGADAAELAITILCFMLYGLYHVWYFVFQGQLPWRRRHEAMWGLTLASRELWTEAMISDPKEAIVAVQTVRNSVTGVSLLSAAETVLISQLLSIITDPVKLEQVAKFASSDPFESELVSPEVKIAIALGSLFISVLAAMHSVRLSVHLGYLVRIVPGNSSKAMRRRSIILAQRSALYFAIGLRFFYAFIPLIMWMLGTLSLLISTVVLLVALFFLDSIPGIGELGEEEEEGGKLQKGVEGAPAQGEPTGSGAAPQAPGAGQPRAPGAVLQGQDAGLDHHTLLAVAGS